jgi:hypothetical protein
MIKTYDGLRPAPSLWASWAAAASVFARALVVGAILIKEYINKKTLIKKIF